jgi:hypothetical protein
MIKISKIQITESLRLVAELSALAGVTFLIAYKLFY